MLGSSLLSVHGSFTDNSGLCGIPALRECGPHLSVAAKIGMVFGSPVHSRFEKTSKKTGHCSYGLNIFSEK
jgi:hypothetical protein